MVLGYTLDQQPDIAIRLNVQVSLADLVGVQLQCTVLTGDGNRFKAGYAYFAQHIAQLAIRLVFPFQIDIDGCQTFYSSRDSV